MRIAHNGTLNCEPTDYTIWLSANDTYRWATTPDKRWPCSELSGNRLVARVDGVGLYDLTIDGQRDADCDATELIALIGDHLPAHLRHLWPTWEPRE